MKELDAKVNAIFDHMKPSLVMKLVQEGENPLDLSLDELDAKLQQLADGQDISPEEKYSRYLWKMEKEQGVTEQERDGYIGLYRLLHQVENSDGAAIGSVMEAGWEMNLRNLLRAVRTEKRRGVDAEIDDDFGGLSDLRYTSKSITQQIENGFHQQNFDGNTSSDDTRKYYQRLNHQILDEVTPSVLREVSDGEIGQILDQSLEKLKEQIDKAQGNPETEQMLYEQLALQVRETIENSQESVRYLEQLGLPDTITNIQAAQQLVSENYDVYQEVDKRKKDISRETQEEFYDAMEAIPESLESTDAVRESYGRLYKSMEAILERSYEKEVVTSDELRSLKQLSTGMIFQNSRVQRHSYDVPVLTGDHVTTMNVTLIRGEEDTGRVQIFMQDISAELRVHQGEVKGLILCDDREMYESLFSNEDELTQELENNGYQVKNISYSMNHRSRVDAMTAKAGEKEPSSSLYRVAKTFVCHVMKTMQQENI